jgi:6-phosphogluconolactonase
MFFINFKYICFFSGDYDKKWLPADYQIFYPESLFEDNRVTAMATSANGDTLYAATEGVGVSSYVSSFDFNRETGVLTFLNRVSSGGNGPAYISVDNENKFVFVANYNSGSLSAVSIKDDGSFGSEIQSFQYEGSSINPTRQKGPHVHCAILSPDKGYLVATDLGTDRLYFYHFDASRTSNPLTPAEPAYISLKPGSGPRHIIFHPESKKAYLVNEMEGSVTSFNFKNGNLIEKQTITLLSSEFEGKIGGADIHISPDGKFLYASNRGDANEIVIFAIRKNGGLSFVKRQSAMGKSPRNFVIDPSGRFFLVGNQESNEVVIFKRDLKTGLLSPTGKKIHVSKPVCLKFTS